MGERQRRVETSTVPRLHRWARQVAAALVVGLVAAALPLAAPAPAQAATASLHVPAWDVDGGTGRVTYAVRLTLSELRTDTLPCGGSACAWQVQALYRSGTTELLQQTLTSGSYAGTDGSFTREFSAADAALPETTHLRARLWASGTDPDSGYETAVPVGAVVHLSATETEALAAFAPDFDFSYDVNASLLVGAPIIALASEVCRAAETEILRGGQSKGPQFANGTVTTTQVALQALCLGLAAAGIAVTTEPWLPPYRPDDPATWPEPDPDAHPYPESYPDGPGGSGNWPSTAAGGFCDDGEVPPPEDRTHPLDISTEGLSEALRQDVITHARLVNSWLAKVGGTTVVSPTVLGIVDSKRTAGAAARNRALDVSEPFQGHAGHVPDTALSGTPDPPCGWLDMAADANRRAGAQLRGIVGQHVTHVIVDGIMP